MQFYLNGYKPGDPLIEDPHPSVADRGAGLAEDVDLLIVGSRHAVALTSAEHVASLLVVAGVMGALSCDRKKAEKLLSENGGNLRKIVAHLGTGRE